MPPKPLPEPSVAPQASLGTDKLTYFYSESENIMQLSLLLTLEVETGYTFLVGRALRVWLQPRNLI